MSTEHKGPHVDHSADAVEASILEFERGRRPAADAAASSAPPWLTFPELVQPILDRAEDPWISLNLRGDEIARVRVGATVVLIGGSGSGKSSLTLNFLMEHARTCGPAIALSIELPSEELAARGVGIECDASWEDALRGRVPRVDMDRALALPRLYVLDRRRATIKNLEACVDAARAAYPHQPILVAVDYAQLLDSKEREARMRVADAFAQIDDVSREKRFVALALSQMSRQSASRARQGDAIGAESSDLGAESAAIERFATLTLSIGMANEREDGTSAVELSVGKARMGKGDRVIPMTNEGRTGRWSVAGEAKTATEVREQRDAEKETKDRTTVELAMLGMAAAAPAPLTRKQLMESVTARRRATKLAAIGMLLAKGDLIEVNLKQKGTKYHLVWTADRARAAGMAARSSDLPGMS